MARILGIDLGAWAVKVAVLEGSFGRFRLQEVHSRRVPTEGGQVPGYPERLDTLRALLHEEELQGASASAVAWAADRASVHVVDLPFDDRSKIERTLPFEVENHVPFEIDEMTLVHRVLSRKEGGCRVLVGLVEREGLRERLAALKALGLDPRHMSLDADMHAVAGDGGAAAQAVVDLGHSRSLVTLVRDGAAHDLRALHCGGVQMDRHLRAAFGFDAETAEAWRRATPLEPGADTAVPVEAGWDDDQTITRDLPAADGEGQPLAPKHRAPEPAAVGRVLREGLLELVGELRTTLISFEDRHGVEIDELLLTGGLSAHPGLASLLSHELGVPVRFVAQPGPLHEREDAHGFALALALARLASGEAGGAFLELRRGELAHHSALQVLRSLAAYGAAAAAFFVIAMAVVAITQQRTLSGEISEVESRIATEVAATFPDADPRQLQDPSMAVAIMQEGTLGTAQRVEALKASLRGEPPSLTLLKELSQAMPPATEAAIDVRELVLSETAISIKADTDGYEQASNIEASLQARPRFKGATKGDEKKRGEKVQFTISIPLGDEPDEGEEG
ncbi:MAG: type II secretion system protein GspL [Pseudomonadota bacterium]